MSIPRRSEVIIAVLGLVGVLSTAVISNYDKISGSSGLAKKNSTITSDDVNIQLRYLVEVSGLRASLETMEKNRVEKYRAKYHASKEVIECMTDMGIQTNQLIDITVSALKNNLTISDIKELNAFFPAR